MCLDAVLGNVHLPCWCFFVVRLLDDKDNCTLSVPLSTSDLHYSCWQSCEICQVFSIGAFTLFCHVFIVSRKIYSHPLSLLCYCLAHAFSARCFLSCRPDTASSAPVCCCHRDSLTRGRRAFALEAVRESPCLAPRLVLHVLACVW